MMAHLLKKQRLKNCSDLYFSPFPCFFVLLQGKTTTMKNFICLCIFLVGVVGCKDRGSLESQKPKTYTPAEIKAESEKAIKFFDDAFEENLAMFPEEQTYLGRRDNYNKWNDLSKEHALKVRDMRQQKLIALENEINFDALDEATQLSYLMFKKGLEEKLEDYEYRHYNYRVNQMFGTHADVPSFLINMHKVTNYEDATAYLDRVEGVTALFGQLTEQLKTNEEAGILLPKFVFPMVIRDCKNLLKGYPMTKTGKNTIYEDFEKKLEKLDSVTAEQKKTLLLGLEKRLMTNVKPAYENLIKFLEEQEKRATEDDGAWKFPKGKEYFDYRLRKITTTDLTADEIHQIGLDEVKRIHGEMEAIKEQVGFKGTLSEFFDFMETDKQFYYSNDKKGKEAYMAKAVEIIDEMRGELDKLFITKPKAGMIVRAVEAYREKSAGKAFYNQPAPDGSRPGIYYANTYDMAQMPKYQMEALAYHEGIPGHHMQLSIAQEMEGLPKFRRFDAHYTAYVEGWGLYSEYIPKEIGYYKDPYSDFGRLAMELWRACRLVVDTGIHSKKWTREKGIAYYMENTSNPEGDCIKMVDRHIVMPGQATAYKIGMLKILELRDKAKNALGDQFDIRKFHEIVLSNGALPLDVLEELIDDYIQGKN